MKNRELHDQCQILVKDLTSKLSEHKEDPELKEIIKNKELWRLPATFDLNGQFEGFSSFANCYRLIAKFDTMNSVYDDSKFDNAQMHKESQSKSVLITFLSSYFQTDNSIEYNDKVFEEKYNDLEEYVYTDLIKYRAFAPLKNFTSEKEIKTSDGILLRKISGEDYQKLYKELEVDEFLGSGYLLEMDYSEKKQNVLMHTEYIPELHLDKFVSALQIFKSGDFGTTTLITEPLMWHPMGTRIAHRKYYRNYFNFPDRYTINSEELQKFIEFWNFYRDNISRPEYKKLGTAIRRFSISYQRDTINDKIIDLMIAFESLFLEGVEAELKYRLSTYVASFLGKDSKEKKEVFKLINKAYKLRSEIVHGGSFPFEMEELKAAMHSKDFKNVKLEEIGSNNKIVIGAEDYLRESLRKFIYKIKEGKSKEQIIKEIEDSIFG